MGAPQRRLAGGRCRLHQRGHLQRPGRVPGAAAAQDHRHGQLGQRPHRLGAARGQRLHRAGHQPASRQPRLPRGRRGDDGHVQRRIEPVQVEHQRGPSGHRQRGRSQRRARAPRPLPHVRQRRPTRQHPSQPGGSGAGAARLASCRRVDQDAGQQGVRAVVAQQVGGDPVGHAQGPGQQRPLRVLDLHQATGDQRAGAAEALVRRGAGRRDQTKLQCQPDARPPAADVVVQVSVEALEARVDVRRQRHQQQLHVDRLQPEAAGQFPQPHRLPPPVRPVRGRLDLGEPRGGQRVGRRRLAQAQQPGDLLLGQVEPAEGIVGIGVVRAAVRDQRPHPGLHHLQPPEQVRDAGPVHFSARECGRSCQAWSGHRQQRPPPGWCPCG